MGGLADVTSHDRAEYRTTVGMYQVSLMIYTSYHIVSYRTAPYHTVSKQNASYQIKITQNTPRMHLVFHPIYYLRPSVLSPT